MPVWVYCCSAKGHCHDKQQVEGWSSESHGCCRNFPLYEEAVRLLMGCLRWWYVF